MKKILFLTHSFPFPPGEQFIEEELIHWAQRSDASVILVPSSSGDGTPAQAIPQKIRLDTSLTRSSIWMKRLSVVHVALLRPWLYQDLLLQFRMRRLSLTTFVTAIITTLDTLHYLRDLKTLVSLYSPDIIYAYWNSSLAYAAAALKGFGFRGKIVSRAHRFDLYELEAPGRHHCLKRIFVPNFSSIYCLSPEAVEEFKTSYGAPETLEARPLGVFLPEKASPYYHATEFHVVSCSFCVQKKRIDRIIQALELLAKRQPERKIRWTHLGGGPLLSAHQKLAKKLLSQFTNLRYTFRGMLSQAQIKEFYQTESVSAILNLSESEGIPVSILEAMGYAIPAVASDVGSTKSAVHHQVNGYLLSSLPSLEEVSEALIWLDRLSETSRQQLRSEARRTIQQNFESQKAYRDFIDSVLEE